LVVTILLATLNESETCTIDLALAEVDNLIVGKSVFDYLYTRERLKKNQMNST